MIIENVQSPADLKGLSLEELNTLAKEIRQVMLQRGSVHGGHFGPNFGMVEAIVAMHYVFDSPQDKIVFDVSHQSYPHKILTGRAFAWLDPVRYDEVSGYSEPSEREHDHFVIGHTSTSISLASGLAKGRDLTGGKENIIAVIGDGSLSGGEAFEGLDFVGEMGTNFIAVINDNQQSIAENHGGLYRSLQELRESGGTAVNNYFRSLGLDYMYIADGNDLAAMISAFQKVKDIDHPIALHINTLKGKGYRFAEENKEAWHYSGPFDIETGQGPTVEPQEDYQVMTAELLLQEIKSDPTVAVITAGTPACIGFWSAEMRQKAGRQFIDVGIAEEHAVALASGMATRGAKPVFSVFSCFIQRTYDQLNQDLCINGSPATILTVWGSPLSMNDVTHACWYDLPLLINIPGLVYLCPTTWEEYTSMLTWAIHQTEHPVAVRMPFGKVMHEPDFKADDWSQLNKYKLTRKGREVAIIGLGNMYHTATETADLLKAQGIDATVINPRYATGLDEKLLGQLKQEHRLVITIEDGILDGGFGEKIARHYGDSDMKVKCYGLKKEFADRYNPQELLRDNRLTAEQIAEDILKML